MGFHLKPEYAETAYRASERTPENAYPRSPLQLSGRRSYSPGLGRWLSRDPIGVFGGLNLSGFVRNDPVRNVDSVGYAPGSTPPSTPVVDRYPGWINCLGYATGADRVVAPDPAKGESLKDVVEREGFVCTGPMTGKCECKCDESKMILYVHKYPHQQGSDPYEDPFPANREVADYHAIKSSSGCGGSWSYFPGFGKKKGGHWGDAKDIIASPADPKDPDTYWTQRKKPVPVPKHRYCCCKPKK